MSKVRWGVISTAKIGTEKVIPAMQHGRFCQVDAIASRDAARARTEADRLGVPKSYGSYDQLLNDPDIDAIYNPLPNHLHVPVTLQAMRAGKHVLCEKPIALSSQEAQQLIDAAEEQPELKVMEAFMYRHHPQWIRARELVRNGAIGELRTIQSFFSYFNDDPENIRNVAEMGGGGLMDIGCYSISLSRYIFESEPIRVVSLVENDRRFHVDRMASAVMEFPAGTATFTCSTQLTPFQRVNLFGLEGRVEIEIPFNAPNDQRCRMWHQRGERIENIELPICDQYTVQGDLFSQAILENGPVPTPLTDAIANIRVIEAIVRSGKTGTWEPV